MIKTTKSLYLGHNLTLLAGTTPKTTSPGDILEIIKKENEIKSKIVSNWRTHARKTFDKTKPKSQPNTPEIQRLSLSFNKITFSLGQRNYHIYQYSENAPTTTKIGSE